MQKSIKCIAVLIFLGCLFLLPSPNAGTSYEYTVVKAGHAGGDVTPSQAMKMVQSNKNSFLIDVRTRPEFVLVGHPTIAYHVPVKIWTGKHTTKGYGMNVNPAFGSYLKAKFNPATDTLIFMCRSGGRSCTAADLAAEAGWPTSRIFNMLGGFEGDKIKNPDSALDGKRIMGGWKNEGLPWTYAVNKTLAYPEME
ncbi:MAG: hypothetical protein HOJ48_20050 [Desulfobacula sp.]|jgi:rhodanese-related sulfurtransferase|nr:hypothetical protein [Desulfobacula sp.]